MEDQKACIKAIDNTTVHRICSGQVVLSLAIAVKELVENSIDAGATVVDVRLKDYGIEYVEVSDNGHGVHPDNFAGLTLKHHTSKLRDFSDLIGVETYGFRGEALSSLCALSNLTVITRHKSIDYGTELMFDRNGHIQQQKQCARQIGTTVSMTNLFSSLPVRYKEFHKNIKREFNKMTQLLYAYCLVSTGVKITCINQTQKGSKTTFVATHGCRSVKENISCIFGSKQLNSLLELKQCRPSDEVLEDLKVIPEDCDIFSISGYISSCSHGMGRSTNDRQFCFINSRPCEPSKIIRTVNEVYHQYNVHQTPFVYLNISVAKESVDVNVTPDKRQIFLNHEKLLVSIIKASLLNTFKTIPSTFGMNNLPTKNQLFSINAKKTENNTSLKKPNISVFGKWRAMSDNKRRSEEIIVAEPKKCKLSNTETVLKQLTVNYIEENIIDQIKSRNEITGETSIVEVKVENVNDKESYSVENEDNETLNNYSEDKLESKEEFDKNDQNLPTNNLNISTIDDNNIKPIDEGICSQNMEYENGFVSSFTPETVLSQESGIETDTIEESKRPKYDVLVERDRKFVKLPISLDNIKNLMEKRLKLNNIEEQRTLLRFKATIDPAKNELAEQELNKEITKDMFAKMEIIGQFNLGFIITRIDSDLFIIDQHATDEKYNFEMLQKTTVISHQKLVVPQQLELTAANEHILMDNIEIFRKNGFDFNIDEEAPKRISLTAVPMSKNWIFGKEDVDELIFMLEDSPHTNCRPSRVRSMFASRACRKSVMIGNALSIQEMKRLVQHMGEIEHPWNCPHGRPTMRHLINLGLLEIS